MPFDPKTIKKSTITEADVAHVTSVERSQLPYYAHAKDKFYIKQKTFNYQFNSLYVVRTTSMRPAIRSFVRKHAADKYSNAQLCDTLLDVQAGNRCIIIGTLYKEMKLKPNILLEYTRDRFMEDTEAEKKRKLKKKAVKAEPTDDDTQQSSSDTPYDESSQAAYSTNQNGFYSKERRVSDTDTLVIEDEHGRARVVFPENNEDRIGELVSGAVVGLLGEENESGEFVVEEIIYPGMAPYKPIPAFAQDTYVAFISGINISEENYDHATVLAAFEYLSGAAGCFDEQRALLGNIVRTVLVGNNIASTATSEDLFGTKGSLKVQQHGSIVETAKTFDRLVNELSQAMHVDIMPGPSDPSNVALPQYPIHHSFLPESSCRTTVHLVTNPHYFELGGMYFLGTSGEAVHDVKRYTTQDSTLAIMEDMLKYRHLAPTAPDTLNCYPIQQTDPFIIEETPHVYFVGNQAKFEHKVVEGEDGQKVSLISIPSFVSTHQIVLLNMRTLEAHNIQVQPLSFLEMEEI